MRRTRRPTRQAYEHAPLMHLPQSLSRLATLKDGARSGRWIQSLPFWVSAGLVLILAWQLVQLAWAILGARKPPIVTAATSPAMAEGPATPSLDVSTIVNAHLFGIAGAVDSGAANPNAVAATQLNLVLVGTIAESDPEKGYAIIGDSAATAKLYAVGKTITGSTKLHSVYPDRVILDRGGKLEALLMPKKFQGGAPGNVAMRPPPPLPGAAPMLGDRLRELAAQNPGAITEIIRPQPVFANGQQRGYRVYPGRNRQQFTKLGLMPGDLVTAVNGTPLDDPARGMEILQAMNAATDVTVTVERNGQTTQININNAQIAADAAAAAAQPEAIPVTEVPDSPAKQDLSE
jgi:general secretion pathway protein C